MAQSDNILSFTAPGMRQGLSDKAKRVVDESRRVAERTLPKLMNGLFEKLDDALYELADKADTNQLQTAYFDAMRILRRHRDRIQMGFVDGVLEDFERFWQVGPRDLSVDHTRQVDGDPNLALVDEDELEQSLAVSNLVSKSENRYHRELYALTRRFGSIVGDVDMASNANPLGPAGICNRFHSVIRAVDVDIPVRLVIYKLFDKQVMNYLGGLYEEVNALLSRSGIMPKTGARFRRESSPPASQGGRGVDAPAGAGAEPRRGYVPSGRPATPSFRADTGYGSQGEYAAEDGKGQTELFRTFQELLVPYRTRAGRGVTEARPKLPIVATPELLVALNHLQDDSFGYAGGAAREWSAQSDLRSMLAGELELERDGKAKRVLEKADEDTLDVVSMLFDFLLDDPNLPDAMKALIGRLQIPMLKVVIIDKTFFNRKLHPARRLLNSLARAALGWSDDGDRSENSLYGRIESIVNRIISDFGEDPSLFEDLNDEFSAFMEREQRGAEVAEERTNQVTRGKEQLRLAKKLVGEEIERRLAKHPQLPQVVCTLLEDGWKDVLLLSFLRQGPESGAWTENLRITDRLIWSVEPKGAYEERQELLRAIPDLLRQLREGLNGISYDQHKMAHMFKELQSCHIASLRAGSGSQNRAAVPQREAGDVGTEKILGSGGEQAAAADHGADASDIKLPADSGSDEIRHDKYTEMAENLAVGTWLELEEDDGRLVRIKLSWKSDVSDAYVFVNRRGLKVLEMTMVGVAKLFRNGSAQILQDVNVPIMDRALGAMLETLKNA